MNEKNNVSLEGVIVDGYMDVLPNKDLPFASVLICSSEKKADGSIDKLFYRARFPVSPDKIDKMAAIFNNCRSQESKIPHFLSVSGELRNDKKGQPFVLAKEKDTALGLKPIGTENKISINGEMHKILNKSAVAVTVMVKVDDKNGKTTNFPVTFNSHKHPIEWAGIINGKIKEGDSIKVSGKLDGRMYAHSPGKDLMTVASIIAENAVIKAKKLGRPEQIKPNQVK